MGKMLEVFKQAAPRGHPPADPQPVRPASPDPDPSPAAEAEEEIPFIEVGGRNTATEASAAVLASAPPAMPREVALTARADLTIRSVRLELGHISKPRWKTFSPRFASEVIAAHDLRHLVSGQYEALLHQILGPIATKPTLVIWFSGAAPRCGATTVVLNLALTAARLTESPVTVVEANSRRPALSQRVGLLGHSGDVAWLQANAPPNLRFVIRSDIPGPSLASILELLQAGEGLILVDGPSMDELSLSDQPCDAVFGVRSSGQSRELTGDSGRPMDGWIVLQ
jgi:hypothetical protein